MELPTLEYWNFSEKWKNDKLKTGKSWESWSFLISEFPILALGQNWKLGFEESQEKNFSDFWDFWGFWVFNLSFWTKFCPFTPLSTKKSKCWKNEKNTCRYHHFTLHDHMLYCSWDMACDRCSFYFSFWAIFCTFTP